MRARLLYNICVMLLAMLLLAIGQQCARGRIEPPVRAGEPRTKVVRRVVQITSMVQWQRSGFWKIDEVTRPWWLVYADETLACPLYEFTLRQPKPTEFFQCPTEWRIYRRP